MRRLLIPLCALVLAGCENNAASLVIDNTKDHSISLVREQSVAWVGAVEQRFVVSRFPECQRRFNIDEATTAMIKVDLYEVRPMLYAAQQGDTWYALSTEECRVQKFKPEDRPASAPGRLVGSFIKEEGELVFKDADK